METPIKQKRTTKPKTLQVSSHVFHLDDSINLDAFELACHIYYSDDPIFGLMESKAKSPRMKLLKFITENYRTILKEHEHEKQKEDTIYNQLLDQYIRKIEYDYKDIYRLRN